MTGVLVTGGLGFIGSALAEELVERGYDVRILDNISTGNTENISGIRDAVEFVKGDIRDKGTVKECLKNMDYVMHEAADASVPGSIKNPELTYEINVRGTLNILSAAVKSGVNRIVFASSCAVYGNSPVPQREGMKPRPLSPYALTKVIGEKFCETLAETQNLEIVSLRYFNVFGPRQNPDSEYAAVVPKFITKITQDIKPTVYGDGNQTRDFVYVKDVVAANILATTKKGISGRVFNIGSGKPTSINDLLEAICRILGKKANPIRKEKRAGDTAHSLASTEEARKSLGFEPAYSLDRGLKETTEWFKKFKRTAS